MSLVLDEMEARAQARDRLVSDARADPVVAAVLARFPGAEIVDVRVRTDEPDPQAIAEGEALKDPDDLLNEDN